MPSHTNKWFNRDILWILGSVVLVGALRAFLDEWGPYEVHFVTRMLFVVTSYAMFAWYCNDSDALGYRRNTWCNICWIFLSPLFVPWYLLRTRPPGRRAIALLKLSAMCLAMLVALVIGILLGLLARPAAF